MIPLSIVAASVIAVAAAIFTFSSDKPRTADQSGITLQTLIVTAVLVVMAGIAAVVITGITRGQSDRLERAGATNTESNCERWEIFDPNLASLGRGGTTATGGVQSSAKGCVRVCYLKFTSGASTVHTNGDDLETGASGSEENVDLTSTANSDGDLVFSRSNHYKAIGASTEVRLPVNGVRSVDDNGNASGGDTVNIASIGGSETIDHLEIRVTTDSRSCMVYNTTDNDEVFRA